jgi:hypothetical protein
VTSGQGTRAGRGPARHDEVLAVVGRRGLAPGVVLLEDDRPAVYCVPGRRRIVFTTGDPPPALALLATSHCRPAHRIPAW